MIGNESAPSVVWWGCLCALCCALGLRNREDPDTWWLGYLCLCCGLCFCRTFIDEYSRGARAHADGMYEASLHGGP